jgi:L-asparaginase
MPDRPRVLVLALGGTIAMTADGHRGVAPQLDAAQLVAAVPALGAHASVDARSFRRLPGAHLSFDDVAALAYEVERAFTDEGFDGAVVTQGTDTLEETAFLMDLLSEADNPVVMTGAMRNPTLPGADGPANLLAAVQVAGSPHARGLGTLVVMGDEIHGARFLRKSHATRPSAFESVVGPLGWVAESEVRVLVAPRGRALLPGRPSGAQRVALVTVGMDDDARVIGAVASSAVDGMVVEALGAGHVPAELVPELERVAARMPVVLTSRTGQGEVLRSTYDFPGSERDLLDRGLIWGGWLTGPKARVLLTALLRCGVQHEEIGRAFACLAAGTSWPGVPERVRA